MARPTQHTEPLFRDNLQVRLARIAEIQRVSMLRRSVSSAFARHRLFRGDKTGKRSVPMGRNSSDGSCGARGDAKAQVLVPVRWVVAVVVRAPGVLGGAVVHIANIAFGPQLLLNEAVKPTKVEIGEVLRSLRSDGNTSNASFACFFQAVLRVTVCRSK